MDSNDPSAIWDPSQSQPQPQPQAPAPHTGVITYEDFQQLYGLVQTQQQTIDQLQHQLSQAQVSRPFFSPDAAAAMAHEFARVLGPTLSGPANAQPPQIPSHGPPAVRFPNNIPPFDGKAKHLPAFLFSVQSRLNAQLSSFQTESQKIEFFAAFLGNGPGLQYLLGLRRLKSPCLRSYTLFLDAFRTHFEDPDLERTMKTKLKSLRQTGSVSDYAARFLEFVSYVDYTESTKCDEFFEGLSNGVKEHFRYLVRPKILDALIKASIEADSRNRTVDSTLTVPHRVMSAPLPVASSQSTMPQPAPQFRAPVTSLPPKSSIPASPVAGPSTDTISLPTDTPMEVSATHRGKISAEERARRKAENLCFYCGGDHHISSCPTVPSDVRTASLKPRIV